MQKYKRSSRCEYQRKKFQKKGASQNKTKFQIVVVHIHKTNVLLHYSKKNLIRMEPKSKNATKDQAIKIRKKITIITIKSRINEKNRISIYSNSSHI